MEEKIKCVELGKKQYENQNWGDGSMKTFKFYFSPQLDTCLAENRMTAIGGLTYTLELFDILGNEEVLARYFYCGYGDECQSSCKDKDNCTVEALKKYEAKKNELVK